MQLTLREISEALIPFGGSTHAESVEMNTVASGYSIDTRTLKPGELFFAIRGPHFDGHDFISSAFERGACGAVVSAGWAAGRTGGVGTVPSTPGKSWLIVPDTAGALQKLATRVRQWWGGPLVAITGSAGKTTTKEICATLLGSERRVYKSEGNLNNLFGVPLTLLRLDAGADVAVIELAMSAREEIRTLTRIAVPNLGVITNVNPVHMEFFSSIDEIARAKREMAEELGVDAVAVLNADDPLVAGFAAHTKARVVTFGEGQGSDVRIENVELLDLQGSRFDVVLASGERLACRLRLLGMHNVRNAVAGIAAAVQLGISPADVTRALEQVRPAKMRGEVLDFAGGFTVVDDTYNSNPRALTEVISALALFQGFKRKVVVAGEMLELGPESRVLHATCGRAMAEAGFEVVIAVQGEAAAMAAGAREAGLKPENVYFFPTPDEAGKKLCEIIAPGDLVLLKGSRGVRMERTLETLRQKFSTKAR